MLADFKLEAKTGIAVRKVLTGTSLTANWGHLMDKSGDFCSCECDVIIHHEEGLIRQWDGTKDPIMNFGFIDQESAVVVVSCKSYLRSSDIDREYCKLMEPFVKRIWLFAECCGPRSPERIRAKALEFGYEKFWHIYTWSKQTEPKPDKAGWGEFVEEVKRLKQ